MSSGARFTAMSCKPLAVCLVVSVCACGGSSERFNRRDPGGGGTSAGSGAVTGGSGDTGGTSSVIGGSGGNAGASGATGGPGGDSGFGGAGSGGTTAGVGGSAGSGASGGSGAVGGSGAIAGSGGNAGERHPSTIGCRDPEEPGCITCCEPDGSNCIERFPNRPSSGYGSMSLEGPCPESCPRCAQCRISEESDVRLFGCRPDCDCVNLVIGVDPCINGLEECGCYCANAKRAGLFDCSFVCE